MTNRANTVCTLKILTEYSDAGHILRMQDLIGKMKGLYGSGRGPAHCLFRH